MIRFGRLALLVVAIGGFVSAHALVQSGNAMEVPVPTVSVPSLPVPTPTTTTVPSLPAPTLTVPTVPPPTTTPPPVTLPPSPVPSLPPTRPAPAPESPQPATTSTATAGSPAPAARTAAAPSRGDGTAPRSAHSPRRSRALAAETHRTAQRVSVRLVFLLPKAQRRFLIVRGPAPSCRVAGYIPVRGRKGVNTVYFAGRVHGRRLEPGVYSISLSPNRRLVPGAATEYVRVVSPRRSLPLPDDAPQPSCATAATLAVNQPSTAVLGEAAPPDEPTAQVAGVAIPAPTGDENDDGAAGLPDSGVLGVSTGDADEKPFLAIAVLVLVGGLLVAMMALVTRFLRGSWNP